MGGYRDRRTGLEHLNVTTQTEMSEARKAALLHKLRMVKNHRETQTADVVNVNTQTYRECGTQMSRRGVIDVDDSTDKIIYAREYFSSEDYQRLRWDKAVTLQCWARGLSARKRAQHLRALRNERQEYVASRESAGLAEADSRRRREVERRMNPKKREDFEILFTELEAWRLQETRKIDEARLPKDQRQAAMAELLKKESKLLQTIDRLKQKASIDNRESGITQKLELMAAPKKWAMSDGQIAEVHTPFTTRAKELLDLYNGLKLQLLTVDERVDVLLHVKWTVKEFDCNLTREIVDLVDREADLLNRGRSERSVATLRQRLSNLFLQFIETPEFNPEAARFLKVPENLMLRPSTRPLNKFGGVARA